MGQDRANPAAMILSATMMLRHLGSVNHVVVSSQILTCLKYSLDHIANKIAASTFQVLNAGRIKTADMGGKSLAASGKLPLPYNLLRRFINHFRVHCRSNQES